MLGFNNPGFRDDVIASTRFHRLLRRGREYGPGLSPEQAVADGPDTDEHGIHFICIVANILRQFEFVQNAWVTNPNSMHYLKRVIRFWAIAKPFRDAPLPIFFVYLRSPECAFE